MLIFKVYLTKLFLTNMKYTPEKKNNWSKDLFLGVCIYLSFGNPNSLSLVKEFHPPESEHCSDF